MIPAATGISSLRDRYSRALYILLGIVALVLTIACANMANLLMAQSVARRRELALRLSLGAGRWQLVRQLLVESVMLSVIGALGGLAIAAWGSRALVAMLSSRFTTVALDLSMDWRVFAFTAGVGVLTGLLFGVAPAFRGSALTPIDALRDQSRGVVSGGRRLNVGHALVALQVASSFVLVFGSTLFVRTLVGLTSQGMGFESERVLIATVDLRRTGVTEQGTRTDCSCRCAMRWRAFGHRRRGRVVRDPGRPELLGPSCLRARRSRRRTGAQFAVQRRDARLLQDPRHAGAFGTPLHARGRGATRPASSSSTKHSQRSSSPAPTRRPNVYTRATARTPRPASSRSSGWWPTRSIGALGERPEATIYAPSRSRIIGSTVGWRSACPARPGRAPAIVAGLAGVHKDIVVTRDAR